MLERFKNTFSKYCENNNCIFHWVRTVVSLRVTTNRMLYRDDGRHWLTFLPFDTDSFLSLFYIFSVLCSRIF